MEIFTFFIVLYLAFKFNAMTADISRIREILEHQNRLSPMPSGAIQALVKKAKASPNPQRR